MFRAHLRNASGELDVFEAASYFSGEVNEVGLGVPIARRAEQRRSFDAPKQATTFLQLHPQKDLENQFKDKKKHREHSFNRGKLANFVRSFFHQKLSRKKSKSDAPADQLCKNVEIVERQEVRRSSSDHHVSMIRREIIPSSCLRLPLEELKKPISVCLDIEVLMNYTSAQGSSYNKAQWAEVLMQKEDRWCRRREEEEDGGASDSSSDLFELKSCGM